MERYLTVLPCSGITSGYCTLAFGLAKAEYSITTSESSGKESIFFAAILPSKSQVSPPEIEDFMQPSAKYDAIPSLFEIHSV